MFWGCYCTLTCKVIWGQMNMGLLMPQVALCKYFPVKFFKGISFEGLQFVDMVCMAHSEMATKYSLMCISQHLKGVHYLEHHLLTKYLLQDVYVYIA